VAERPDLGDGRRAGGVVLATVKREQLARDGKELSAEEEDDPPPILEKYEHEGSPYYSTARLWDDGILDPARTREALALGSRSRSTPRYPAPIRCV
jgi:acetyl-CoA carboxylase carboxyltransferase component